MGEEVDRSRGRKPLLGPARCATAGFVVEEGGEAGARTTVPAEISAGVPGGDEPAAGAAGFCMRTILPAE